MGQRTQIHVCAYMYCRAWYHPVCSKYRSWRTISSHAVGSSTVCDIEGTVVAGLTHSMVQLQDECISTGHWWGSIFTLANARMWSIIWKHLIHCTILNIFHTHNYSRWKMGKGRIRAEHSDPMGIKVYFRCRVSIDRSTPHPPSVKRAGCPTCFGFILHIIRCGFCLACLPRDGYIIISRLLCQGGRNWVSQ